MNVLRSFAATRIGLSLLSISIGGCAVGPDFKSPAAPAPKSWSAADDARVEANKRNDALWWRAFNDATLNRLVETGAGQNLELQIAGLRIVEARAQLAVATGQQYPQVSAFGSARAIGLSENISAIGRLPRSYAAYNMGFDAAWELDFWGKFRRGVEAEVANVMASTADYYSGLVSLTAEIARAYVVIRTNEVLVEQAVENVRIQEESLAIAESRFKNGATSELDPTQARTQLESTRATIPLRQTALQQARNALSTLLGQPPGNVTAMLGAPTKEIPRAPAKVAVGVPAEVLRRRPDVRAAELFAAAQSARIGVAKADLYPSFSIVGTVGLDSSTRGTAPASPFREGAIYYSVGPQVNWAFLDFGRRRNAVRVQDARFQQLVVNYRNVVIKAAQEVEDALVGFLNAQQSAAFEENAVVSAKRAVELAIVAYREGDADYQRVLDAQRALLTEETTLADTKSAIATNLIALYKALGGGWQLQEDQPVIPEETKREMEDRTSWGNLLRTKPKQNP